MKPDFLNQSICLSRIPKDKIKQDPKTGEKWINITAALMRNEDKNGNTYAVYVSQGKDEPREERAYIGKGKEFYFKEQVPTQGNVENMPAASSTDDLPY